MFYSTTFSYLLSDTKDSNYYMDKIHQEMHSRKQTGFPTTSDKYRIEQDWNDIRIVKIQHGIGGIRIVPDALVRVLKSEGHETHLEIEIKLSAIWLFMLISLHLLLVAFFVASFFSTYNFLTNLLGIVGSLTVLNMMIYAEHISESRKFRSLFDAVLLN